MCITNQYYYLIKSLSMKFFNPLILLSIIIGISLVFSPVLAVTFDPNNIISDAEILDASSMSLTEIDQFLKGKGGYISTHNFSDHEGVTKSTAEIIYNAAHNWDCENAGLGDNPSLAQKQLYCQPVTINPRFLLVLLQKEQSLIDNKTPTQGQLDWATGYGCPDGGGCNDRWRGIGKQVNSASLQFFDYMENPNHYKFRPGNTYILTNTNRPDSIVTVANRATAALYNYTPHVYNGNFNFFKLWLKYFTVLYPSNTLLQVKGEVGVWLIKDGIRRPFLSKGALTSRYDINKIVQVNKSDLEKYIEGDPIKFHQYALIRSPRGTVFLLVDDKRRGFASGEALRLIGINPEEIIDASWDDINVYTEGVPITATSTYPMGALLQDKSTGGIYYVSEGTKAPLWDAVLLKTKFKNRVIIQETPEKLASYKTVEPAIFGDGELIKTDTSPGVYVIDSKTRRAFTSGDIFEELGYKWENIITVPKKIFELYAEGEQISQVYSEENIEIIDPGAIATPTEASSTEEIATTTDELLQEEIEEMMNP